MVLPEGLHTQSNKPRDPNLIPTELTIDAPAGVTVDEIVWPKPTDFKVEGLDDLLAVFEHESIIGVQLTLASSVPNGDAESPGSLPVSGVRFESVLRANHCRFRMDAHSRCGGGRRSGQRRDVQGDSVRKWFAGFGRFGRFSEVREVRRVREVREVQRVREVHRVLWNCSTALTFAGPPAVIRAVPIS